MTPATLNLLRLVTASKPGRAPATLDQTTVTWLLDIGLGPLTWHLLQRYPDLVPANHVAHVKAANLSAYMLSSETFDRLDEILDRAARIQCPVTLLKGVSVAQQWYPERHWRPMRDIDVLVRAKDLADLEQQLRELGYQQTGNRPPEFFVGHQHSMPFFHPSKNSWVEVHTSLFRPDSSAGMIAAFQADGLRKLDAHFMDRAPGEVLRLGDELQLIYTAVHWASKLTLVGGLIPIFDSLLILNKSSATLDWDWILDVCRNNLAARHLWLMLSYLEKHELYIMPDTVRDGLANGRRDLGILGLGMLHNVIDSNMAARGRDRLLDTQAMVNLRWKTLLGEGTPTRKLMQLPWRVLFPPAQTGRYNPARQWKRLTRALGRSRKQ